MREDLRAALAPTAQCFQGFCIEDPDRAGVQPSQQGEALLNLN